VWQFAVSFKVRHHCSPLVNELGIATEFNTVALSSNKTVFYTSSDERRAFVAGYWVWLFRLHIHLAAQLPLKAISSGTY